MSDADHPLPASSVIQEIVAMFVTVRCRFHSDRTSNIYVSPLTKERPEDLSLEWVDYMAELLHPAATEPIMHAAFIEQYKSPLGSKELADKAYYYAKDYCALNLQHLRSQAEAIRDQLTAGA